MTKPTTTQIRHVDPGTQEEILLSDRVTIPTEAEVLAGTDNIKAMTVLRTKQMIDAASGIGGSSLVRTPTLVTPTDGAGAISTTPTLTSSTYYSLYGIAHAQSQVQIATDYTFTAVTYDSTVAATTTFVVGTALSMNESYYWRVRYQDAEGNWSNWSNAFQFSTGANFVVAPTLTQPTTGQTGVGLRPTLKSSAFAISGGSDTHWQSQWQVSLVPNFSNIYTGSGFSPTYLTQYTITRDLPANTTVYFRVRHRGTSYGWSAWSPVVSVSTSAGSVNIENAFTTLSFRTAAGPQPEISTGGIDLLSNEGMIWTTAQSDWVHYIDGNDRRARYNYIRNTIDGEDIVYELQSGEKKTNVGGVTITSTGITYTGEELQSDGLGHTQLTSWIFKKKDRFFDIVKYTGDGQSTRALSHSLGVSPGAILVLSQNIQGPGKQNPWWHRSLPAGKMITMNEGAINTTTGGIKNATVSQFSVGIGSYPNVSTNAPGHEYTALVFAHDPSSSGVIQCGSFQGNSTITEINLGWEPQWIMIWSDSTIGHSMMNNGWGIVADMNRGLSATDHVSSSMLHNTASGTTTFACITPNTMGSELHTFYGTTVHHATAGDYGASGEYLSSTTQGFRVSHVVQDWPVVDNYSLNKSGQTYYWMAIRRPEAIPTAGSQVLDISHRTVSAPSVGNPLVDNAPVNIFYDVALVQHVLDGSAPSTAYAGMGIHSRWIDLYTSPYQVEPVDPVFLLSPYAVNKTIPSYNNAGSIHAFGGKITWYAFKKAPKFMDIQSIGANVDGGVIVNHKLQAVPELVLIFTSAGGTAPTGPIIALSPTFPNYFNSGITTSLEAVGGTGISQGLVTVNGILNNLTSSTVEFGIGLSSQYPPSYSTKSIVLMFATLAGVSKVGTYVGNGTTQHINCGFSTGARFILHIPLSGSTKWLIFDSVRGIVAGADKIYDMNNYSFKGTGGATGPAGTTQYSEDVIDPYVYGFDVNVDAGTEPGVSINRSGETYLYLAIA